MFLTAAFGVTACLFGRNACSILMELEAKTPPPCKSLHGALVSFKSSHATWHYFVLRYDMLRYVVLRIMFMYYVVMLHYLSFHCVPLFYVVLHYVTLQYALLCCITLSYLKLIKLSYIYVGSNSLSVPPTMRKSYPPYSPYVLQVHGVNEQLSCERGTLVSFINNVARITGNKDVVYLDCFMMIIHRGGGAWWANTLSDLLVETWKVLSSSFYLYWYLLWCCGSFSSFNHRSERNQLPTIIQTVCGRLARKQACGLTG